MAARRRSGAPKSRPGLHPRAYAAALAAASLQSPPSTTIDKVKVKVKNSKLRRSSGSSPRNGSTSQSPVLKSLVKAQLKSVVLNKIAKSKAATENNKITDKVPVPVGANYKTKDPRPTQTPNESPTTHKIRRPPAAPAQAPPPAPTIHDISKIFVDAEMQTDNEAEKEHLPPTVPTSATQAISKVLVDSETQTE